MRVIYQYATGIPQVIDDVTEIGLNQYHDSSSNIYVLFLNHGEPDMVNLNLTMLSAFKVIQ